MDICTQDGTNGDNNGVWKKYLTKRLKLSWVFMLCTYSKVYIYKAIVYKYNIYV